MGNLQADSFRQCMRSFIEAISDEAKQINPDFQIIPQNAECIFTDNGEPDGNLETLFLSKIDGMGKEILLYGFYEDDVATPDHEREYLYQYLDLLKAEGKTSFIIDYSTHFELYASDFVEMYNRGYLLFESDKWTLNDFPSYPAVPYLANVNAINSISDAHNFMILINTESFESRQDYVDQLSASHYDVLIIDMDYEGFTLTTDDLDALKLKPNGARRQVISYMSIGEAESYRYYWQPEWKDNPPDFLVKRNSSWANNYTVRYWFTSWHEIIIHDDNSYIKRIANLGFDGVYLDKIDSYAYFEKHDTTDIPTKLFWLYE